MRAQGSGFRVQGAGSGGGGGEDLAHNEAWGAEPRQVLFVLPVIPELRHPGKVVDVVDLVRGRGKGLGFGGWGPGFRV